MWKLKEELVELRRVQQELLDEQMAQAVALSEANLSQLDATANRGQPQQSELWVDRYKPKRYADLLGDDVSRALGLCLPFHLGSCRD